MPFNQERNQQILSESKKKKKILIKTFFFFIVATSLELQITTWSFKDSEVLKISISTLCLVNTYKEMELIGWNEAPEISEFIIVMTNCYCIYPSLNRYTRCLYMRMGFNLTLCNISEAIKLPCTLTKPQHF